MPTIWSVLLALLQPWSTATVQTRNSPIATTARIFSNIASSRGSKRRILPTKRTPRSDTNHAGMQKVTRAFAIARSILREGRSVRILRSAAPATEDIWETSGLKRSADTYRKPSHDPTPSSASSGTVRIGPLLRFVACLFPHYKHIGSIA